MTRLLTLADAASLGDLDTYLQRADRVEDGAARLIAVGGVLAVYTAVLVPRGILDRTPTVLGLRTFALHDTDDDDAVVPIRALLERIARVRGEAQEASGPISIPRPPETIVAGWAGIAPPRGGWVASGETDAISLSAVARAGIDEVAAAVPTGTGEQLVQRVRSEVWGRAIDGLDGVPAGAAFAAFSLGFLGDDPVARYDSGAWVRLTTRRGHVLARRTLV